MKTIDGIIALMTRGCTAFAMLLLSAIALVGAGDIFGINVLQAGIPGAHQISEETLAAAFFLGLPLAQRKSAHIDVDILVVFLPRTVRQLLSAAVHLCVTGLFGLMAWQAFLAAQRSFDVSETAMGALTFPIWPVKVAMFVGLAVSMVIALHQSILGLRIRAAY